MRTAANVPGRACIVAVGNELLTGSTVDTNSAWVGQRLTELGIVVSCVITVGDDIDAITKEVRRAIDGHDVVIITGGLGPTHDDVTRDAIAAAAGVALVTDKMMVKEIRDFITGRGHPWTEINARQAELPVGASWMPRVGTAPGIRTVVDGTLVFAFPGVPIELKTMAPVMFDAVTKRFGAATTVTRTVRTNGSGESAVADLLGDLIEQAERDGVTVALLAGSGEAKVKLTRRGPDRRTVDEELQPHLDRFIERLGAVVVGVDDEGVEHAVARAANARGVTVATAESITGGAVAATLVSVPGASAWFAGGIVAYADDAKVSLAGWNRESLEQYGPVSSQAAMALAEAAQRKLGADVGVGVVGVAGPDTQNDVPVGTVWVAVVKGGGETVIERLELPPIGRAITIRCTVTSTLGILYRTLAQTEQC